MKMNELLDRFVKKTFFPLLILLGINIVSGILTFRAYGMSWDEPLFYNYADSIRMAYTPQAFSPGFDFEQVFGKSPEDHKIYGPAYLLLAHPVEQFIMSAANADLAPAWHLVNFLTFQAGLIGFFFLIRRWISPWSAAAATAFFSWQPVFWGHAFINPKDIPFMVLFLFSMLFGFNLVDRLTENKGFPWKTFIAAVLLLGLSSATRIIGPLAGILIFIYFILKRSWRSSFYFLLYALLSIAVMFIFWPYLWSSPVDRFIEVLKHMSNNPTELAVLFEGQLFRANAMPRRYLLEMMFITLTEPTWILFLAGLILMIKRMIQKNIDWRDSSLFLGLFVFMMAYLVYNRPSVYDGFRHFLFIMPPVFAVIGFAFEWFWQKLRAPIFVILVMALMAPGVFGIIHLYPYEYAYYNQFVNGLTGAYRNYETDYWLTCYKEAVEWTQLNKPGSPLHIQREFDLAEYYNHGGNMIDLQKEPETAIGKGDLILFHTRGDLDIRSVLRKLPVVHTIGRDGAVFCMIKQNQ